MNRAALEHIVRAAAAACGEREIVIIGSQAVLGQFPEAREKMAAASVLRERLKALPVSPDRLAVIQARLRMAEAAANPKSGPRA
ncbi:MAG: hypothetical protein Q8T13_01120 [Acidobacteriota bacterium]|nr:hypothetical protein [Acidobacteriota bacterium]